ncbi:MAG: TldD/PmbA family protein [Candidatus Hodarchaeota archaeon]
MKEYTYDEILSLFEEIANSYKRTNQYFDILFDSFSMVYILKTSSVENVNVQAKKSGIVARTFDGTWKEIALDDFSNIDKIKEKMPKFQNMGNIIEEYDGWELNKEVKMRINPEDISIDEKLNMVRDVYGVMERYDNRIVNPYIYHLESLTHRIFVNNEGCLLRQVIPRIRVLIKPIAKEGSNVDYDYEIIDGEVGLEIYDQIDNSFVESIAQSSIDLVKAQNAPSGKYPIIMDPGVAGIVAHESFGHGLEADQILRARSYLKDKRNKKVASEICNISDDASIEKHLGSYFFDDEGIKSSKNILVKNGILKDFIYDRRTASEFNTIPKGNGRRESYAHPINVRMSNTFFEPGDYNLDEMISDIKYGCLLLHGFYGMEDPLGGGLQCSSKKGFLIENGEKTKILKSIAMSGHVLDLLNNIDAISNDKLVLHGGTCGKGSEDYVRVTTGGTYIRVKEALVSPGG